MKYPKLYNKIQELCSTLIDSGNQDVFVKGYLRYERIRKMNVPEFKSVFMRALENDERFDDIIDELIEKEL